MIAQRKSVLIVEDEPIIRETLAEFLMGEGFEVRTAANATEAIRVAQERDFDVGICDIQLPDGDGIRVLKQLHRINPAMFVMIISAYPSVETAVEAFTAGAFEYLVKPVRFEELVKRMQRLFKFQDLYRENQRLRKDLARSSGFDQVVGSSAVIQDLLKTIRKVAATNSNVLLVGETGTGKELFAREIHMAGPNASDPFMAVNCGTRPVELLEAQLFGTSDGQTGALISAGSGTVFLDEVAQLPAGTQSEILRAIEYSEVTPVGGTKPVRVSARIIAATSRELSQEVTDGNFQEDLFYRLDGVKIRIPALRERLDDIPELVEYFIVRHRDAMGKRVSGATSETIRTLMAAHWKGNIRQLDNAIERAVMMCEGEEITPNDLPPDLLGGTSSLPDTDDLRSALRHYERLHITRVLRQCPDKKEAARRLVLGLSSLYRKIEELKIEI
ncbi:MAG TPA: sigma-54-dependent Fis family transcriptional regulator [Planctomycetaceae bacterium]|nr:sigma-54-dependent Fis family transcriptional regulator [Planctomycetaceae bacterium]